MLKVIPNNGIHVVHAGAKTKCAIGNLRVEIHPTDVISGWLRRNRHREMLRASMTTASFVIIDFRDSIKTGLEIAIHLNRDAQRKIASMATLLNQSSGGRNPCRKCCT
ncbi:MAG TPA: hypothetical protein DHE23_25320 [Agrobacterium sp.]|nr:hypothetical protein [Agrobacterium sp.]